MVNPWDFVYKTKGSIWLKPPSDLSTCPVLDPAEFAIIYLVYLSSPLPAGPLWFRKMLWKNRRKTSSLLWKSYTTLLLCRWHVEYKVGPKVGTLVFWVVLLLLEFRPPENLLWNLQVCEVSFVCLLMPEEGLTEIRGDNLWCNACVCFTN